jgi:hypothetical protein
MYKQLLIVLLLFKVIPAFAQDPSTENASTSTDNGPSNKEFFWFSPRVSVTVPHPIANGAFKKNFAGVYELSASFDIMILKGAFIGAEYTYATLKVTGLTGVSNFNYNPLMHINNAGFRVGAQKYLGERNKVIFTAAMAAGMNWTNFEKLKCKDSTVAPMLSKYSTSYLKPEINIYFLVESNFAIGATLSYSIYRRKFDPAEICLNDWKASVGTVNDKPTQYLAFGFGFYYSFYKKKP